MSDSGSPVRRSIEVSVSDYLKTVADFECRGLYKMVMDEAEEALLRTVFQHCGGNRSRASEVLGINRNTLRNKLSQYHIE